MLNNLKPNLSLAKMQWGQVYCFNTINPEAGIDTRQGQGVPMV